jgi:hypothetical protein
MIFIFSAFLVPHTAHADHIVKKTKQTTKTCTNGQSQNSNETSGTTWLSKNKMRQDEGDSTVIIRLDKKKLFIIDHADKTYSEMDLPVNLEENLASEAKQIIQVMKISSSVTETQEIREIKDWRSQKFLADISISIMGMDMPMTMEIWASKETGIDLRSFGKFYAVLLSMNPFTKDLVEEFQKIAGYPVMTKISMRVKGVETISQEEVIRIEATKTSKDIYEFPSGYTQIAYNPLDLGNTKNNKK